ncbi:MAG: hypothetical protein WAM78_00805 [Candidatus Sulfotelmatobacter sp.]
MSSLILAAVAQSGFVSGYVFDACLRVLPYRHDFRRCALRAVENEFHFQDVDAILTLDAAEAYR